MSKLIQYGKLGHGEVTQLDQLSPGPPWVVTVEGRRLVPLPKVVEALRGYTPTDAEAAVAAAAAAVLDAADDGQVASVVALSLNARGQACRRWRADLSPEDLQSDAWRIACREALAPSNNDDLIVY